MPTDDLYLRVVPELADLRWPDEVLASCSHCSMAPRPGARAAGEVEFTAAARCCTYHPALPNVRAGRALRRGGIGAERIRARLDDRDGVSPLGIGPTAAHRARWAARADDTFGRDEALTCPYWVEGDLGCGIHADRNAVCRTWFCKVEGGQRSRLAWMALQAVLHQVEGALAERCVADGDPPSDGADAEAWATWFLWCAHHADALDDEAMAELRGPRLEALLAHLDRRVAGRDRPMPEVLQARVHDWVVRDDGVALSSWSPYDRTLLPPWVFTLLAELDGRRTWREAVDAASQALGRRVPIDLVPRLWRRGLVGPPEDDGGPDEAVVRVLPGD